MGPDGVLPRRLLFPAVRALEPRPRCSEPGGADRSSQQPLLFLLHRAVAAGGLLFTRLLIVAAVALFLMNSVGGRIWCGYLCPQTVWTDLFYAVERLIEGDRR